ncbi:hypothetical protein D3C85_926630 [compost metagenome]
MASVARLSLNAAVEAKETVLTFPKLDLIPVNKVGVVCKFKPVKASVLKLCLV